MLFSVTHTTTTCARPQISVRFVVRVPPRTVSLSSVSVITGAFSVVYIVGLRAQVKMPRQNTRRGVAEMVYLYPFRYGAIGYFPG